MDDNIEIEVPQYGIVAQKYGDKWVMSLRVSVSGAQHEFFLGLTEAAENIAEQFHKQIMKAARDARRAASGLVVVKGGNDAAFKGKERWLAPGSGNSRPPRTPA